MSPSRKNVAVLFAVFCLCGGSFRAPAQPVLFDFNDATVQSSLPLSLTVDGVTAQLSDTGGGFSIQPANTMGFTPAGFSGNCLYPNGISASDLIVSFPRLLADFSILYAPQELACDSSATMRLTAYLNGVMVGTTTTNAPPGTWPSETLQIASPAGFNRVVVHYDKPPVTGGDYGVIFMADNLLVTPAPPPIQLMNPMRLADGSFYFSFTNVPGTACTVYGTTNLNAPLSQWTGLSGLSENPPGQFQFVDAEATNNLHRFYRVSSP